MVIPFSFNINIKVHIIFVPDIPKCTTCINFLSI